MEIEDEPRVQIQRSSRPNPRSVDQLDHGWMNEWMGWDGVSAEVCSGFLRRRPCVPLSFHDPENRGTRDGWRF